MLAEQKELMFFGHGGGDEERERNKYTRAIGHPVYQAITECATWGGFRTEVRILEYDLISYNDTFMWLFSRGKVCKVDMFEESDDYYYSLYEAKQKEQELLREINR